MTTNASRIPVDFDGFDGDRQPAPARPAPKGDPLAELARIVGQDDPFRALLDVREGRKPAEAPAPGGRIDPVVPTYGSGPTYGAEPAYAPQGQEPAPAAPQPGTPADAFNQYLAGAIEREHGQPDSAQGDLPDGTGPVPERPRGRRRLALVGGALGLVAVSVGGALAWRSLHAGRSGGPILVMADQAPLKIQPQNAGGVEIPDQNKQIYDRNAKDGQIKIVNREEQPVDVQQAARALVQETAPVAGASAVPTSPAGNALTDSLGEPRRVRTVSVRPEPPPMQQQAQAARPAVSPIPTMTMPTGDTTPAASPAATPRPVRPQAATPAPAPEPAAPPKPAAPPPRVAAVEPQATSAAPVPVAQPAVGGFSVQLSVRATESEARAAFKQAQERYAAELGGQQPLIRQAEVNGKSIYRVRVGPMAKESATSLCNKLQAAGGQCFVAKN